MTEATKPIKKDPLSSLKPEVVKQAVDVAIACYDRGAFTKFIDHGVMGGQVKPSPGPDKDGTSNTCANDMISNTLNDAGVKLNSTQRKDTIDAIAIQAWKQLQETKEARKKR